MVYPNNKATMEENWVDFYAHWCPKLDQNSEKFKDIRKVFFAGQIYMHALMMRLAGQGVDDAREPMKNLDANVLKEAHRLLYQPLEGCDAPDCPACRWRADHLFEPSIR